MQLANTEPIPLAADADGVQRVGGTRVSLESVVYAVDEGASPEEIVERFPTLELADVYLVVGYVLRHRREVEAYLDERRKLSLQACEKFPTDPELRGRLLSRKRARR